MACPDDGNVQEPPHPRILLADCAKSPLAPERHGFLIFSIDVLFFFLKKHIKLEILGQLESSSLFIHTISSSYKTLIRWSHDLIPANPE